MRDHFSLPTWQQLFDLCPYSSVAAPVCPHLHAPHFAFSYFTTTHLIIRPSLILRTIQHRNRSVSLFTSSNDRNHDPFSSQLSRLHWWYSAGLFPTGVFAIFSGSLLVQNEGLCLSPFLKRVPGVPLILYRPRGFGTCVRLFVASFFRFLTM